MQYAVTREIGPRFDIYYVSFEDATKNDIDGIVNRRLLNKDSLKCLSVQYSEKQSKFKITCITGTDYDDMLYRIKWSLDSVDPFRKHGRDERGLKDLFAEMFSSISKK